MEQGGLLRRLVDGRRDECKCAGVTGVTGVEGRVELVERSVQYRRKNGAFARTTVACEAAVAHCAGAQGDRGHVKVGCATDVAGVDRICADQQLAHTPGVAGRAHGGRGRGDFKGR